MTGPSTTLAVIGDVHHHLDHLDAVIARIRQVGVDGVLLVGDLGSGHVSLASRRTPRGDARYLASVETVLERVRAVRVPMAYVPGNHDLPDLSAEGNIDGSLVTVAGLEVYGIGGAGPHKFGFCYEWDESFVQRQQVPACDVLLVHCPPHGTSLDLVPRHGLHAGSEAIRDKALEHHGFLVCGHIHESPGATQLGDCLCLNVGGLGAPFGRPQVGFIRRDAQGDHAWHQDLESGTEQRWTRT